MLANVLLWVSTSLDCAGAFFGQQGGIWVLAGLALSSQKLRILTEYPLAGKAGQKN